MSRPLTCAQTLENQSFLEVLTRTGNIREAARAIRRSHATMIGRREAHPAFAQGWDAALALAQARLHERGSPDRPHPNPSPEGEGLNSAHRTRGGEAPASAHRTKGGEAVVVQRRDGTLQLRRAQPGKLTRACEQAFLTALSATANVRLSAAAAGASPRAFYRRKRTNPGFAREMQLALEMGYERLEMALIESFDVDAHEHDDWQHNEPPPIPAMTPSQALQLLYLHHKTAKLWAEAAYMKHRRGETSEMWSMRRAADYRAQKAREAEQLQREATNRALEKGIREARRRIARRAPALPALDQVTGWSKADPEKVPHDPDRALIGGWRIGDMKRRDG